MISEASSVAYSPPCWVNPNLQKSLAAPIKISRIFKITGELWEASGGEEQGFQEFFKYISQINFISYSLARKIWDSCNPAFIPIRKPRMPLSALSPPFERSCPECIHKIPSDGGALCRECFETSEVVMGVIKYVLD